MTCMKSLGEILRELTSFPTAYLVSILRFYGGVVGLLEDPEVLNLLIEWVAETP